MPWHYFLREIVGAQVCDQDNYYIKIAIDKLK